MLCELHDCRRTGRNNARQAEEKVKTLNDTLANVQAKALADTHSEKLKEVELQILETEWPTCKTDTLVDPLPNKLTEEKAQTSLETLAEIKAEALVVGKEEALTNKLTYTIT